MADIVLTPLVAEDYPAARRLWTSDAQFGFSPQFDTRERIAAYLARNPDLSTAAKVGDNLVPQIALRQ